MGNLSEHFNHQDFFCKCDACKANKEFKIHLGLVGVLEALTAKLNKPIQIKRAYRCEAENDRLGGGRKSFHLHGKAVHIYVDGMTPQELFKHVRELEDVKGIGLNIEEGTVHIDMRNVPDREEWVKEKGKYITLTPEKKHLYGLE